MSLAIVEEIAREIVTRLEAIDEDSGYAFTPADVVRPRRIDDVPPQHLLVVVAQTANEIEPEFSRIGEAPAIARRATFAITCFVMYAETEQAEADADANTIGAELVRAIASGSDWDSFDGNAMLATVESVERINSTDGGTDGVTVTLSVLYRTPETNPLATAY